MLLVPELVERPAENVGELEKVLAPAKVCVPVETMPATEELATGRACHVPYPLASAVNTFPEVVDVP